MPNTIKTISLTDDDKCYLNKLLTQSTLEIRIYQRAKILLLKSEGASNEAIADKLDIGIGVVKRCLNKFKENGVEAALHDNKGRGRKAEITDDDITWVINKACQKPKDYGYSAEFWYPMSFRKFINSIAEAEGHPRMATVAETTLRKILRNARIKHPIGYTALFKQRQHFNNEFAYIFRLVTLTDKRKQSRLINFIYTAHYV